MVCAYQLLISLSQLGNVNGDSQLACSIIDHANLKVRFVAHFYYFWVKSMFYNYLYDICSY
jgi:hypothetical protein